MRRTCRFLCSRPPQSGEGIIGATATASGAPSTTNGSNKRNTDTSSSKVVLDEDAAAAVMKNSSTTDLTKRIHSMINTAPFLRSLPPDTYVSYHPTTRVRHLTMLVDGSCSAATPPFTRATYLLRSFEQQQATPSPSSSSSSTTESGKGDGCTLIHLPHATTIGDAQKYVDRLRRIAAENKSEGTLCSQKFSLVVLPEFNPWIGNVFGLLEQIRGGGKRGGAAASPLRIATGATMAAFLSDPTFFDAVRSFLIKNHSWATRRDEIPFAAISSEHIDIVGHGSKWDGVVSINNNSSGGNGGGGADPSSLRRLEFSSGDVKKQLEGQQRLHGTSKPLPHFVYRPLFVYDRSTRTLFSPETSGVRLPWLPHVSRSADSETVMPVPHAFHASTSLLFPSSDPLKKVVPKMSPLASTWIVEDELNTTSSALRQFTLVQRVLSSSYGEVAIDREAHLSLMEKSTDAVVAIRKRLSGKLYDDNASGRVSPKDGKPLVAAVEAKLQKEMIFTNTQRPSSPSSAAAPDAAGREDKDSEELARRELGSQYLAAVSEALTAAAFTLVSTEGAVSSAAKAKETRQKQEDKRLSQQNSRTTDAKVNQVLAESSEEISDSKASAATLKKLFVSRGLESLNKVVDQQDIDMDVFLAMKPDEMTKTFRLTFGLTKKLQLLQSEVLARVKSA